MNTPNSIYHEWLQKAEEDEFAGKAILDAERYPAPACFHFQQVAEKSLKALLAFHNQPNPKVHDLISLASSTASFAPDISTLKEDIKNLNQYYIETRYPGDHPQVMIEDGKRALQAATRIKEFVLEKINK